VSNHIEGAVNPDGQSPATAIMPAGGWRIRYTADGESWSEPLVGWALTADGEIVPLATDSAGLVWQIGEEGNYRIYHPDATEPEPPA
jgi:hypothetical protein